jgi:16S rRNA (guanine527-N7)-methyltransferase
MTSTSETPDAADGEEDDFPDETSGADAGEIDPPEDDAPSNAVPSKGPSGPRPRAPKPDAEERAAASAKAEEEDLAGHPETRVPPLEELREALAWAFQGEEIAPAALDLFARHALLVLEHNRFVNLTAVVDPREMAAKHYLDSWRVTRLVPLYGKSVLDMGSGAGFPGVPVAIGDKEVRVTLLDSTQKRVAFLQASLEALKLPNCSAVCARAEDHLARNNYDVVLVRAVSSVRENVRLLRKVRHSHKDLVMLKGPSWSREVRAGEREAERLGFKLDTVMEHDLPGEMGKRAILVYRAPGGQGR